MTYNSPSTRVAQSIRSLLAVRGETIAKLSEMTYIPESTLKRRLLGRSPFTLEEAGHIAEHFDVSISDLLSPPFENSQVRAS